MKRNDNIFDAVALPPVESNVFDLSHVNRTTFNMGSLVPVALHEVLPGDNWRINFANLIRFAPLVAPAMVNCRIRTDFFFVPCRILFPEWEEFITGTSTPPIEWPYFPLDDAVTRNLLAAYMGVPIGDYKDVNIQISAIPFAGYAKIWDDYYRDQNLQQEIFTPLKAGNNYADYSGIALDLPKLVNLEHDMFTSALPFPQQGVAEVSLPLVLQNDIPVELLPSPGGTPTPGVWKVYDTNADAGVGAAGQVSGPSPFARSSSAAGSSVMYDPRGTLVVDVQSEAATINDLREAFALQAFLERSIRGGQRYIEQNWAHFKVKSSDARLMRPEFIGRHVQNMTVSEVLATAQSNNDAGSAEVVVGQMAGHGISVGSNEGFSYYAEEHGFVFGLMSVIPDTEYLDGLHRHWFRDNRFSYAFPTFAHLGEQEIKYKEVLAHDLGTAGKTGEETFGYTPRYAEYKYQSSRISGQFATSEQLFWTLARKFDPAAPPALNAEFVAATPNNRIFAVTDDAVDHIYLTMVLNITVNRRLPRFGIPHLVG